MSRSSSVSFLDGIVDSTRRMSRSSSVSFLDGIVDSTPR